MQHRTKRRPRRRIATRIKDGLRGNHGQTNFRGLPAVRRLYSEGNALPPILTIVDVGSRLLGNNIGAANSQALGWHRQTLSHSMNRGALLPTT
jgi:hypothetical protein